VADITIQGVKSEIPENAAAEEARMRTARLDGSDLWNGNTWRNSTSAKALKVAMKNADRAQKRAGSPPANLLTCVRLHPAREKAKRANDRFTSRRGFRE
jgi:hypothetical protein